MRIVCLLFACVAVALGGSPGYAADLAPQPVYYPPPPPPPLYTWTGFYFGGNGGFGGDQFQYPVTVGSTAGTASLNSSGFFGGGQVGFNWQMAPAWVIGVETDFDGADITGNATAAATVGATATAGTKLDWFGTVRGRAGFLVTPSALLYGTGGWAYGHTTTSATASLTGVGSAATSLGAEQNGWTVGGGLEYAFNPWLVLQNRVFVSQSRHGRPGQRNGLGRAVLHQRKGDVPDRQDRPQRKTWRLGLGLGPALERNRFRLN